MRTVVPIRAKYLSQPSEEQTEPDLRQMRATQRTDKKECTSAQK